MESFVTRGITIIWGSYERSIGYRSHILLNYSLWYLVWSALITRLCNKNENILDIWVKNPSILYNPGEHVIVDEQHLDVAVSSSNIWYDITIIWTLCDSLKVQVCPGNVEGASSGRKWDLHQRIWYSVLSYMWHVTMFLHQKI